MSTGKLVVAAAGALLIGAIVREHVYRRGAERQYRDAAQAKRELELQVGEVLASHQRLQQDLAQAQRRSQELSDTLASTQVELERTVARLTEETQNARALQARFAAMQRQMDQLQGELAVTLEQRQADVTAKAPGVIQLERVIVSDETAANLQGRVVSIHHDWGFVVINLGWDAVRIGDTVSIFHEDQLLAKARVDRVQEDICAATILPAYQTDDIRVNDVARIL